MRSFITASIVLTACLCVVSISGPRPVSSDLMKKKTEHAQAIFKYLALGDLGSVQKEAAALEKVVTEAGFNGKSEKYKEYGNELVKIIKALEEMSAKKNAAGSYYQFTRMSAVCFSCHEHIRDKKEEGHLYHPNKKNFRYLN
jgi:hypothetical protein